MLTAQQIPAGQSLLKLTLGMQAQQLPATTSWKRAEFAPGS